LKLLNDPDWEDYRYERKFRIQSTSVPAIEAEIQNSLGFFRKHHPDREINNIYLDTEDLYSAFMNIEGVSQRLKLRIRWYGELFGYINRPTLELKLKKGLAGSKRRFEMKPFLCELPITPIKLGLTNPNQDFPVTISSSLQFLKPTLLNQYKRKYYINSEDIRITIDYGQVFYRTYDNRSSPLLPRFNLDDVVIEVKYAPQLDSQVSDLTSRFPFRMTRHSKYVTGIFSDGH
jgi:hypothetical protein